MLNFQVEVERRSQSKARENTREHRYHIFLEIGLKKKENRPDVVWQAENTQVKKKTQYQHSTEAISSPRTH